MQYKHRSRIYIVTLLFVMMIGLICPSNFASVFAGEAKATVKTHFIDVGQGDCTFVELPDGKTLLIDAGEEKAGSKVVKYIKKLGYTSIDYVVATHSDSDHVGGLIKVIEKLDCKTIYRPFTISTNTSLSGFDDELFSKFESNIQNLATDADTIYVKFLRAAYNEKTNGIPATIRVCTDKESILSEDPKNPYMIRFFLPFGLEEFKTERIERGYTTEFVSESNDSSALILLTLENSKYLFAGDVTATKEVELIDKLSNFDKEQLSSVTLLKVGHHGSEGSTSLSLLSLTNPAHAVIMVGEGNEYGHPHDQVLIYLKEFGCKTHRTDELGTIVVEEIAGVLYFSNIETLTFFQRNQWLFYTILGIIVVGLLVLIYIYPKIANRKKGEKIFFGFKKGKSSRFEEGAEDKNFK